MKNVPCELKCSVTETCIEGSCIPNALINVGYYPHSKNTANRNKVKIIRINTCTDETKLNSVQADKADHLAATDSTPIRTNYPKKDKISNKIVSPPAKKETYNANKIITQSANTKKGKKEIMNKGTVEDETALAGEDKNKETNKDNKVTKLSAPNKSRLSATSSPMNKSQATETNTPDKTKHSMIPSEETKTVAPPVLSFKEFMQELKQYSDITKNSFDAHELYKGFKKNDQTALKRLKKMRKTVNLLVKLKNSNFKGFQKPQMVIKKFKEENPSATHNDINDFLLEYYNSDDYNAATLSPVSVQNHVITTPTTDGSKENIRNKNNPTSQLKKLQNVVNTQKGFKQKMKTSVNNVLLTKVQKIQNNVNTVKGSEYKIKNKDTPTMRSQMKKSQKDKLMKKCEISETKLSTNQFKKFLHLYKKITSIPIHIKKAVADYKAGKRNRKAIRKMKSTCRNLLGKKSHLKGLRKPANVVNAILRYKYKTKPKVTSGIFIIEFLFNYYNRNKTTVNDLERMIGELKRRSKTNRG